MGVNNAWGKREGGESGGEKKKKKKKKKKKEKEKKRKEEKEKRKEKKNNVFWLARVYETRLFTILVFPKINFCLAK